MPPFQNTVVGRYLIAALVVAIAVGVRWLLDPWFQSNVAFITIFAAIAFLAWYSGTGPAVFAALVGGATCAWLFLPARLLFQDDGPASTLVLLVYLVVAFLIVVLGDYARRRGDQAERAARDRRDSEGQLRLIVDTLPMLISFIDRDLRYGFNNQAYQRWFGNSVEDLGGRLVRDVLGDAAFEIVLPMMQRALAGETVQFETTLEYRDAGTRQVGVTYVPHHTESGVRGFFALVDDVTDRHRAEMARAHLAAIFESAGDAVISKDLTGRVLSWNSGAEQLFGYSAEEMIGVPIMRIVPEDLSYEEEEILERMRAGERVERLETERLTKDSRRVPVSVTVSPIRDDSGRVIGASKIARDITQRRSALRALEQSEARFRALADNAPMLIWRADAFNRGVWFNRYWLEFTGRSMEEELAEPWRKSVHPDDVHRVHEIWSASGLASRDAFEIEFRMRRHDGQYRWLLERGAPVFDGPLGEFSGYIASSIDITERKQALEQLAQDGRRKDEFLATLAHELRNPLAPILNAAQLQRLTPSDDPAIRNASAIIERQARHMTRLVDDLLDVSRISSGRIVLRRERLMLEGALKAAVEATSPAVHARGQHLHVQLPTYPVYVDGDLTRLSQVFGNILGNAVKYTPNGGRIEASLAIENDLAVVRVRDNGDGIDIAHIDRIFEMFAQVESSLKRQHDGLGLGLNIARRLVELHGGQIEALSDGVGKGTEFVVRLPRIEVDAVSDESHLSTERAATVGGGGKLRLLVADDNPDVRHSFAMMLELDGHEVHVASDGLEAIDVFQRVQPDIVLMDIGMPNLNGYDAARRIRALPGGKNVQMIAVTGWGQESDRDNAFDAGFDQHWTKPIEYTVLQSAMARAVASRS
jgi:PAS domain S-box-containing protein